MGKIAVSEESVEKGTQNVSKVLNMVLRHQEKAVINAGKRQEKGGGKRLRNGEQRMRKVRKLEGDRDSQETMFKSRRNAADHGWKMPDKGARGRGNAY